MTDYLTGDLLNQAQRALAQGASAHDVLIDLHDCMYAVMGAEFDRLKTALSEIWSTPVERLSDLLTEDLAKALINLPDFQRWDEDGREPMHVLEAILPHTENEFEKVEVVCRVLLDACAKTVEPWIDMLKADPRMVLAELLDFDVVAEKLFEVAYGT